MIINGGLWPLVTRISVIVACQFCDYQSGLWPLVTRISVIVACQFCHYQGRFVAASH